MSFFDKFRRKNVEQVKEEEIELGEDDLKFVSGGHQQREEWLKEQIDKLQKEIDSGNLTEDEKYQNRVVIKKYQEELDGKFSMLR